MPTGPEQPLLAADTDTQALTRLHITPFDQELLPLILPSSVSPLASNISFHTIAALPERRYGFLDIPTSHASRLRQRVNGAVLKGSKIRVEIARPSDMPRPVGNAAFSSPADESRDEAKGVEKKKSTKRQDADAIGAELKDSRKVKRGWTAESDSKMRRERKKLKANGKDADGTKKEKRKKESKSQYIDGPECLFKTVLPPNATETASNDKETGTKAKRKKHDSREVVIHEFANTTKFPAFLKSSEPPRKSVKATEFVEGKGWVDEDGKVVEAAPTSGRTNRRSKRIEQRPSNEEANKTLTPSDESSGSNPISKLATTATSAASIASEAVPAKSTASAPVSHPVSILKTSPARPKSSGSAKSLTIKIPPPPATPAAVQINAPADKLQVHPLEALYKRRRNPDGTIATNGMTAGKQTESFSFFGSDDVEMTDDDDGSKDTAASAGPGTVLGLQMPMTPFTRADFELRGQRSAAPTPDTAFASRSFRFWEEPGKDGAEEDSDSDSQADRMDEGESGTATLESETKTGEESTVALHAGDFQKWFWDHRGDLNRSWRKRRKLAAKDKRYRDNRARAERAI